MPRGRRRRRWRMPVVWARAACRAQALVQRPVPRRFRRQPLLGPRAQARAEPRPQGLPAVRHAPGGNGGAPRRAASRARLRRRVPPPRRHARDAVSRVPRCDDPRAAEQAQRVRDLRCRRRPRPKAIAACVPKIQASRLPFRPLAGRAFAFRLPHLQRASTYSGSVLAALNLWCHRFHRVTTRPRAWPCARPRVLPDQGASSAFAIGSRTIATRAMRTAVRAFLA
ncbi:MAG: hypothetical protein JWM86_1035 [Thermoleophilia bacterium]|nr:hypothetical protein [Thermoleophilia bacterium]